MNSKKYVYIGLTRILVISILAMSTAVASADDGAMKEIHRWKYEDEEVHIDKIHRTVAGYAHDDLGPSFYSNDCDIWHYIGMTPQTVATTLFQDYSEEIGRFTRQEIRYDNIDEYTVLVTHIITTTVTYKDHIYQLIEKVEGDTEGTVP